MVLQQITLLGLVATVLLACAAILPAMASADNYPVDEAEPPAWMWETLGQGKDGGADNQLICTEEKSYDTGPYADVRYEEWVVGWNGPAGDPYDPYGCSRSWGVGEVQCQSSAFHQIVRNSDAGREDFHIYGGPNGGCSVYLTGEEESDPGSGVTVPCNLACVQPDCSYSYGSYNWPDAYSFDTGWEPRDCRVSLPGWPNDPTGGNDPSPIEPTRVICTYAKGDKCVTRLLCTLQADFSMYCVVDVALLVKTLGFGSSAESARKKPAVIAKTRVKVPAGESKKARLKFTKKGKKFIRRQRRRGKRTIKVQLRTSERKTDYVETHKVKIKVR